MIEPPLHRDGSVVLKVSQEEIASPTFFTDLGCKMQLGRPVQDVGTVDAVIATTEINKLSNAGIGVLNNPYLVSEKEGEWDAILIDKPPALFFTPSSHYVHQARLFFEWLNVWMH